MLSDAEFLRQFDAGTLDLGAFDHAAHLRAAWLCLQEAPFRDAVGRLRRGLKRLAISAGKPQRYHETITVAYARLVHRQMRFLGNGLTYEQFAAGSPELYAPDLAALKAIYPADILESAEARKTFVPPAAWNIEPVERFLREFAEYQQDLDRREAAAAAPHGWTGAERRAPEPVCVTAVLAVTDVERSARFYSDAFGFDVAPFPQHPPYQFALLTRGGAELMLRAAVSPEEVRPAPGWAIYVRLSGGHIRDLFERLAESHEIVRALQRMPYDDVEFEVKDPDGHIVVVSEWLADA